MAKIPERVRSAAIIPSLAGNLVSQGKVRDTYNYPSLAHLLLLVASDRISIFDFVLNALIPFKGEVLTALTHFWLTQVLREFPNHLNQRARNFTKELAKKHPDLPLGRVMTVRRAIVDPNELIFRMHLGGSVWKEYLEKGTAAGVPMPKGLKKWQKLDSPAFTPSTKAADGHDDNITVREYFDKTGDRGRRRVERLQAMYEMAYAYAKSKGIVILDTKFEDGEVDGIDLLVDEAITPDSSRFVEAGDLERALAENRDPQFLDKEPVRIWGRTVPTPFFDKDGQTLTGINKLKPENPEHVEFVHSLVVPEEVLRDASSRYLGICETLTGMHVADYQAKYLLA